MQADDLELAEKYEHALGDCVDHVGGGMTSIVIGMSRTSNGREVYTVRETRTGKKRQVLGWSVGGVRIGSRLCAGCPNLLDCLMR